MRQFVWAILIAVFLSSARFGAAHAEDIVIHTVQRGENLFRIGLRYGIGWQTIMNYNGMASAQIYAGQQLKIPLGGEAATVAAAPAAAPPPESPPSSYTVVRGDTLRIIAAKFGTTAQAIVSANNIADPNRIFYGQVLTIPNGSGGQTAVVAPPSPVAPTAANGLIVVDISEQHMYVYDGGALIWSWVVSTGERGRDTAPGNYSILNKIPNAYASLWNLKMPNWLGIYWVGKYQNGIHELPILSDGRQLWAGWLGTPVSYGCVILGSWEASTLYSWAAIGTPVRIQW